MIDESKQTEQSPTRIRLLEALLSQVPPLWIRCLQERSLVIGEPKSASREFLKLVYQIEKTARATEQQAGDGRTLQRCPTREP